MEMVVTFKSRCGLAPILDMAGKHLVELAIHINIDVFLCKLSCLIGKLLEGTPGDLSN